MLVPSNARPTGLKGMGELPRMVPALVIRKSLAEVATHIWVPSKATYLACDPGT